MTLHLVFWCFVTHLPTGPRPLSLQDPLLIYVIIEVNEIVHLIAAIDSKQIVQNQEQQFTTHNELNNYKNKKILARIQARHGFASR